MIATNQNELALAQKRLADPLWRINNLYHVIDKQGNKTRFVLNWAQEELYRKMWYCNIILKARQLGISTFICILFLDRCLFNSNISAGIIAHTLEDSEMMFRRVKFAYDNLPPELREMLPASVDRVRELSFANGSSIRVATSLRGQTLQFLHVSEFGKLCSKFPDKAREIMTGSINTLAAGKYCFIESTAEGREGPFYDLCKRAQNMHASEEELTQLDFKFFFFPWWKEPAYRIYSHVQIPSDMKEYFDSLLAKGISLSNEQKSWYVARHTTQGDDMQREYPSTPEESWQSTEAGLYYGKNMIEARIEKRIGRIPYDKSTLAYSAWDLGFNDSTSIWIFQLVGKEIHLIDFIEGSGESLAHWLGVLKSKPYVYGRHLAPHDVMAHEYSSGMTRQASARKMGVELTPVPRLDLIEGIDQTRNILNRCWFDEEKTQQGIRCLENYKKEWNERDACWHSQPRHNWASHGADAFRTLATGLHIVGEKGLTAHEYERMKAEAYGYTNQGGGFFNSPNDGSIPPPFGFGGG